MKINKSTLNLLKVLINRSIKKRRKTYPPHSFKEWIDIPYLNDNKKCHTYDVYLADEKNRKHCCIIDIHGGSYIFGEHKDNYPFAYEMLKDGYDVALVDYEVNDGKRNIGDLIDDCVNNIIHLLNNKDKYDLEFGTFVIAGDSAGGHLALLVSMIFSNKKIAKELGYENLPKINLIATVLNSPVYDFANIGDDNMSNSGLCRMKGPRYNDKEYLSKYSPKTYINDFHLPIFLSTCKNDFIRPEPLKLYEDIKNRRNIVFVDISSDKKEVDHVHNVTKPYLNESKEVNEATTEFIFKYL